MDDSDEANSVHNPDADNSYNPNAMSHNESAAPRPVSLPSIVLGLISNVGLQQEFSTTLSADRDRDQEMPIWPQTPMTNGMQYYQPNAGSHNESATPQPVSLPCIVLG